MKSPLLVKTTSTSLVYSLPSPTPLEMYLFQLILRSKSLELRLLIPNPLDAPDARLSSFPFLQGRVAERSALMGSFSEKLKQELPNEHPSASANTNNTLRESGQACRLIKILKLQNKAWPPNPSSLDSGII